MKKIANIGLIGCIGVIGVMTTEFGIIGVLPQVAETYGISIERAGTLLSGFSIVIALTGHFMTLLSTRFEQKKVMLFSMSLFFISTALSALEPPFWILMVLRMLPAFLQPVFISTALSVAVRYGTKEKSQMMSIVFSGVAIAMVTAVPVASLIATKIDYRFSYLVGTAMSLISLVLIYIYLPNSPVMERKSLGSQIGILKRKTFILSTLMNLFKISAWFSTYSYLAEYLNRAKGMDPVTVSYMFFLFGGMGVLASFVAGRMLSRSVSGTTFFFLSGTVLIPVLLEFSGGYTITTLMVIAIWGFMYAPAFLTASSYMISAAPEALEFANSLQISFGNLGVVIGTTLGGMVIASKGVEYTPWLTAILGAAAMLMMLLRLLFERKKAK